MLAGTIVAGSGSFSLFDVRCSAPASGWSPVEEGRAFGLVLNRRGCFYRWANGREVFVDASTAYLSRPGDEQRIAHPCDGGDRCTVIRLSKAAVGAVGLDPETAHRGFVVDGRSDFEHRRLLGDATRGLDAFELDDRTWTLLAILVDGITVLHKPSPRPRVAQQRRRIVDRVREALATQSASALPELAAAVGVAPHHLSRAFRAHTGVTLTDYRNALRVRLALERMTEGELSLAQLAGELGFADQAHMTRTMRRILGTTPAAVRTVLAP
jgi:AraC-like DNA-binding protein